MMHIVVPMAGESMRFTNKGYGPKPFLPLFNNKTVIEAVEEHIICLCNSFKTNVKIVFLAKQEHRHLLINTTLKSEVFWVVTPNSGPVATVAQYALTLPADDSILIYDSDQFSFFSLSECVTTHGSVVTHLSHNPEMSFVLRGTDGLIKQTVEKQPVSNEASCGVYHFPSVKVFCQAALHDFSFNYSLNAEFRIANLFNFLIKKNIAVDAVASSAYFNIGTPAYYENFRSFGSSEYLQKLKALNNAI